MTSLYIFSFTRRWPEGSFDTNASIVSSLHLNEVFVIRNQWAQNNFHSNQVTVDADEMLNYSSTQEIPLRYQWSQKLVGRWQKGDLTLVWHPMRNMNKSRRVAWLRLQAIVWKERHYTQSYRWDEQFRWAMNYGHSILLPCWSYSCCLHNNYQNEFVLEWILYGTKPQRQRHDAYLSHKGNGKAETIQFSGFENLIRWYYLSPKASIFQVVCSSLFQDSSAEMACRWKFSFYCSSVVHPGDSHVKVPLFAPSSLKIRDAFHLVVSVETISWVHSQALIHLRVTFIVATCCMQRFLRLGHRERDACVRLLIREKVAVACLFHGFCLPFATGYTLFASFKVKSYMFRSDGCYIFTLQVDKSLSTSWEGKQSTLKVKE